MARISFLELPAGDLAQAKSFYTQAFDWQLSDFGPTYSCTTSGDVDVGLQGDRAEASAHPLAVITVTDLAATLAAVEKAGGRVTQAIFAFPGGRRFHFKDPHGNELAAMQPD